MGTATHSSLRLLAAGLALAVLAVPAAGCRSWRGERPPYVKVVPAVAYEIRRDSPEILVLDLRPAEEFNGARGHLQGAVNIPGDQLLLRMLEIGPYRDQTFLVYCQDASCGVEAMAVLASSGFRDAIQIDGGLAAWVADGFDVVLSGAEAVSRGLEQGPEERN